MNIPSTRRGLIAAAFVGLTALAAASTVQAALITWGTPQDITGDSDVSDTGVLVKAFRIGYVGQNAPPIVTVNGVAFQPTGQNTGPGAFLISLGGPQMTAGSISDSAVGPFASLSADYQALLGSGASATRYGEAYGGPASITMTGLTIGQQYEFQWWTNGSDDYYGAGTEMSAVGSSETLDSNLTDMEGGLGQYQIGNFTANTNSQSVTLWAAGTAPRSMLNAFQLRAVPEPTSAAFLSLGALALGARRRR